jgi:hypothetical protein
MADVYKIIYRGYNWPPNSFESYGHRKMESDSRETKKKEAYLMASFLEDFLRSTSELNEVLSSF